ncbi:hypothetical protein ACSGOQ_005565 [Escherichia coli]|uniref:hypothetical protein n=1 Tax=Escherichia coli TaxID=562 RepID=UPI00198413F0|nr:hypothetical protein [Escherichia coli]EGE5776682.1 hypothetical protein [Escherichia coli]VVY10365.1 Uncharacterised protein [Escherichia coli]
MNVLELCTKLITMRNEWYDWFYNGTDMDFSKYPFMESGCDARYRWLSKDCSGLHILVDDSGQGIIKDLLQVQQLVHDNLCDNDPYLGNMIYVSEDDCIFVIQRHGNSMFYIADSSTPEGAAADGLMPKIDILEFGLPEHFQIGTLYDIPPLEFFEEFKLYYNDLQKLSTDRRIEITVKYMDGTKLTDTRIEF